EPWNRRVPARRPRLLLPRAERADPGRASSHRGGDRTRPRRAPACGRPRRGDRRSAGPFPRPRGRSPPVRGGSRRFSAASREAGSPAATGLDPRRRQRRRRRRGRRRLRLDDREANRLGRDPGEESAPTGAMPGTGIRVVVAEGDRVQARQTLVVLEAMKMETPVVAPYEAVVRAIHVAEGDRVAGGAVLVELED